jgi:HSP20 family protein
MFGLIHYDMLDNAFNNLAHLNENSWFARSDVRRNDSGYDIDIELPGLSRSDIDIEVVSNTLKISASRENRMSTINEYLQQNSTQEKNSTMNYTKSWRLPEETNFEGINAKYEAGILRIEVPVKRPNKRKITVE